MAVQTADMGNDDVTGVSFWIYQEMATSASVAITYQKGELARAEGTTDCYLAPLGDDIKKTLVLETRYRAASAIKAVDPAKSSAQSPMSNPFLLREVAPPVRYAPPVIRVGVR